MAKKKRRGLKSTYDSDDGSAISDSVSTSTFGREEDDGSHEVVTWADELLSAIDDLTEKSSAKRANALETIKNHMSRHYAGDVLERYKDTLLTFLSTLLTRGTVAEQTRCAQILSLYAFTINDIDEETVSRTCKLLRTKIAEGAAKSNVTSTKLRATERRVECVRALHMWLYVTEAWDELARNEGTMDKLRDELWDDRDSAVVSEAIHGWTLLASSLPQNALNEVVMPRYRDKLISLLQSDSPDVRAAAGEALALLFEAHINVQKSLPQAMQELDSSLDDIIDIMEDLADETAKHMSRKSRTTLRGHFRSYISTLEDSDEPQEQIVVRKNRVTFAGWSEVIPFHHIKHVVGPGIAEHFQNNSLIRQILWLEDEDFSGTVRKLTSIEKRHYLSKSSQASKMDTIRKSKLTRSSKTFLFAASE